MFDKLIPWKRHNHEGTGLSSSRDDDLVMSLRRDFDSLLSRFWENGGLSRSFATFDENEKEYVMKAEMPGFEPDEIDVKLSGNVLTVEAEHKEESKEGKERSYRYGSYHQSFTLPSDVQCEQIDARYRSGVLELHVPKDESSPSKRITVKAAP